MSLSNLELHLAGLEEQIESLAQPSMRTGVGAVGFRSGTYADGNHREWIQVDLGETVSIDQVVLVPTIWRDTANGFQADGFPADFRIVVGDGDNVRGTVVARFGAKDCLLPRVAPLVIEIDSIEASWVRLEARILSPRGWDGLYILQLSELIVFSGHENVALGRPVRVPSGTVAEDARQANYLVDGFVPYLMDAAEGKQSLAFVSEIGIDGTPTIWIDLEEPRRLNRVRVHATDMSDTAPKACPKTMECRVRW